MDYVQFGKIPDCHKGLNHILAAGEHLSWRLRAPPAKRLSEGQGLLGNEEGCSAGDMWHGDRRAGHRRVPCCAYVGGPHINPRRCHVHALVTIVAPRPAPARQAQRLPMTCVLRFTPALYA